MKNVSRVTHTKSKKIKCQSRRLTHIVFLLDAATKISGYSIYDNGTLVSYGTYHADESKEATERINEIKHWLEAALEAWEPDFVGVVFSAH